MWFIISGIIAFVIYGLYRESKNPGGGNASKLQRAPAPVTEWIPEAREAADEYGLPVEIILAQIWQESTGNPEEVGSAGEIGLMQIKPGAVQDLRAFGYGSFQNWQTDPAENIMAGAAYLHLQLQRSGRLHSALAETSSTALESYNEGYAGAEKDLGPDEYAQEVLSKANKLGYARQ